jgi:hypothetical protein
MMSLTGFIVVTEIIMLFVMLCIVTFKIARFLVWLFTPKRKRKQYE